MNQLKIQSDFWKAILANKKTIEIRKNDALKKIENISTFEILIVDNKTSESLGTLKFSGFIKVKVKDLIHYFKNQKKCRCDKCEEIYWKLDIKTNYWWIKEYWIWIHNYLNSQKEIVIFYIEKVIQIPEVRCEYDGKLLYKIINNHQIQTKCAGCKKINQQILNLKKN